MIADGSVTISYPVLIIVVLVGVSLIAAFIYAYRRLLNETDERAAFAEHVLTSLVAEQTRAINDLRDMLRDWRRAG